MQVVWLLAPITEGVAPEGTLLTVCGITYTLGIRRQVGPPIGRGEIRFGSNVSRNQFVKLSEGILVSATG